MNTDEKQKIIDDARRKVKSYYDSVVGDWEIKQFQRVMRGFPELSNEIAQIKEKMHQADSRSTLEPAAARFVLLSEKMIRMCACELLTVPKKKARS